MSNNLQQKEIDEVDILELNKLDLNFFDLRINKNHHLQLLPKQQLYK